MIFHLQKTNLYFFKNIIFCPSIEIQINIFKPHTNNPYECEQFNPSLLMHKYEAPQFSCRLPYLIRMLIINNI